MLLPTSSGAILGGQQYNNCLTEHIQLLVAMTTISEFAL